MEYCIYKLCFVLEPNRISIIFGEQSYSVHFENDQKSILLCSVLTPMDITSERSWLSIVIMDSIQTEKVFAKNLNIMNRKSRKVIVINLKETPFYCSENKKALK